MSNTVLVTGSNRGIGLEFVKQYLADGWNVIACCRDPKEAKVLQTLQQQFTTLTVYPLEMTDERAIKNLAAQLKNVAIDLLINNAAVLGDAQRPWGASSTQELQELFLINAIAPLKMCEAFIEHVARSQWKKIATLSSGWGSIAQNTDGGVYAYRASKAAVNMLMKTVAVDVAGLSVKVLLLDPGWVQTAMGGHNAPTSAHDSAAGMRQVIAACKESGVFISYQGQPVAW